MCVILNYFTVLAVSYLQPLAHTAWNGFLVLIHSNSSTLLFGKCLFILLCFLVFTLWVAFFDSLGGVRCPSVVQPQHSVLNPVIIFIPFSCDKCLCFPGLKLFLEIIPSTVLGIYQLRDFSLWSWSLPVHFKIQMPEVHTRLQNLSVQGPRSGICVWNSLHEVSKNIYIE